MPDRNKVIKGFECCVIQGFNCYNCTYGDATTDLSECHDVLLKDVLELLKEQEDIRPVFATVPYKPGEWHCGNCEVKIGTDTGARPRYCWNCGKKVKWNDS